MDYETKTCQNCKKDFVIEPDDFLFYEKIKVPPPTFCPECRMIRRLVWRNERTLYKRKCDLCEKNMISIHSSSMFLVYCSECWWSDKWNAVDYNQEYNFSLSFFKQWKELLLKVPSINIINIDPVNSDYCNFTYQSKNCYLNFASDMNEDTAYLYHSIKNKNCFDMLGSRKNEQCFSLVDSQDCYNCIYLTISESCIDSLYCYDCRNCQNCIGCVGLRNSNYYIFNKKYTQKEYNKIKNKLNLNNQNSFNKVNKIFFNLLKRYPRKFSNSYNVVNCIGDYIKGAKNCYNCFDIEGPAEDLKFTSYGVTNMKNIYDSYAIGVNIENCYEVMDTGDSAFDMSFSANVWGSYIGRYNYFIRSSPNCFACIGLRNKKYCILNKQYTKEEYEELLPKIIKHMNDMPYIDKKGNIYKYGEFFPSELSPFAYNETVAQEYFPLTKEEALEQGYRWKDKKERNYPIDIKNKDIPDNINDVNNEILNKVIECEHQGKCNHQCTEAFKIVPDELQFYQRMNIPIPHLCPNCRHYARLQQRNPMKLWHRKCQCNGIESDNKIYKNTAKHPLHNEDHCPNEFETSYSPDRPEIVYCEKCYQAEVY